MKEIIQTLINLGIANIHLNSMTIEQKQFVVFLPSVKNTTEIWTENVNWESKIEEFALKGDSILDELGIDNKHKDHLYFQIDSSDSYVYVSYELGYDTMEEAKEFAKEYNIDEVYDIFEGEYLDTEDGDEEISD